MKQIVLVLLAIIGLANCSSCTAWAGQTIYSGATLQFYSVSGDDWVTHNALPTGDEPQGLLLGSTPATFTFDEAAPFTYDGSTGTQGELYDTSGNYYASDYGGEYVTVNVGDGNTWNIGFAPSGAAPGITLWAIQIDESPTFGYQLGLQSENGDTMLDYDQGDTAFELYVCTNPTPPTPAPTPAPTPIPHCAAWDGTISAITSGATLQFYSTSFDQWVTHQALPIGTEPQGLVVTAGAPSTFTLDSVSTFSYNGATGIQGELYDSSDNWYSSDYGGNYVCVNVGDGNAWNIGIAPNGDAPGVSLWQIQIDESPTFGYQLGLAEENEVWMLDDNAGDTDFALYVCDYSK